MKPTKNQKEYIQRAIRCAMHDVAYAEAQLVLLSKIELRPTKDGKDRKEFADNFGIKGLSTKTEPAPYSTAKRFLDIRRLTQTYAGHNSFIEIRYCSIDKERSDLSGIPEMDGNWISVQVDHLPATPKETLDMIRTVGVKQVKERLAKFKKELKLAKSQQFADDIVALGNAFAKVRKRYGSVQKNPTLCHFALSISEYSSIESISR